MASSGAVGRLAQRLWRFGGVVAGQPIHETHPHLLSEGQLWPGVTAAEFAARRRRLANAMPPGGIAVLPAATPVFMTGAIPYPYRQDADFLYLTGINQQAVAVIEASSPMRDGNFTLFIQDSNPQAEAWNGTPMNAEAASEVFGADDVYPMSELEQQLEALVATSGAVFYDRGEERTTAPCEHGRLHQAMLVALQQRRVHPLKPTLHPMRWRKSGAEVELMRQSASLAAQSLARCMQLTKPGVEEHFLGATFEYECKARGAQRLAYPVVVAGGVDSCTIHYLQNNKRVREGELLLMDAGCELHGYSSDVSRTWPVSGTFSVQQREVYEIVLDTHRQCVEICRAGRTLRDVHQKSVQLLSEGVASLGLFPGLDAGAIAHSAYRSMYPHSVGHWLGMDTHDTRCINHDTPMQAGVVLTVEPGLYIPNDPQLYGPYAGIGVRIEDDVAVTGLTDPEVLSAGVPVDAREVELLVQGE
ncbi:hypothetical protein WJX75_005446 [Coccomyxa subellipsoidea]|uniref:Aminopeptidase P N-terminal domain-containing protein n=1 Tax=Coccomyxa subellipsoidea TaxID=248742 RepID=A0ABR2YMW1_9CHLO